MNRRNAIKSILPAAIGVSGLATAAMAASEQPSGKTVTVAEAFRAIQDAILTDESYREVWRANIAVLLNDMTVPESDAVRQLRVDSGMTPQRLVDPRDLNDCNYFAEQLLMRMFGGQYNAVLVS